MCKNLVEKGQLDKPLIIFNRTETRATDLNSKLPPGKSIVAENLDEAVSKADIIFTCLGDDAAIRDFIATATKANVKGKLFVDCSTVHPDTTNQLAKDIQAKGAEMVACPVFGAPAMADGGQLICVLAGPAPAVKQIIPYCKGVMGRANIDYSDQPQGKVRSKFLLILDCHGLVSSREYEIPNVLFQVSDVTSSFAIFNAFDLILQSVVFRPK